MKRTVQLLLFGGMLFICTGTISWLTVRHILISEAENKARIIIEIALTNSPIPTDDQKVLSITSEIFKTFKHQNPAEISLYRLRPFLTTHRLPEFFRLPDGVMETYLQSGYCDSAGRMLSFILNKMGIESVQWNMVSLNAAHSALLVTMPDNRKVFIDPYFGYGAMDKNHQLIDPIKAQELIKSGRPFPEIFLPLGTDSDPNFYQTFQTVRMAAQGEKLILEATLPIAKENELLVLGEINGDELDVINSGMALGLSPLWHYIGHKYDREWVRVLKVVEPVKIVMTLIDSPEDDILTTTPRPEVNGKTLTWSLKSKDSITFRDGDAGFSLNRFNSYIGVDQIVIIPVSACATCP